MKPKQKKDKRKDKTEVLSSLRQVSSSTPIVKSSISTITHFDITSEEGKRQLMEYKNKFIYQDDMEGKEHKYFRPVKLSISSIPSLGGGLGVIAEEDLKPNQTYFIGVYSGERGKSDEEEDETSEYVFQILNDKKEIIEHIDGKKIRNWSAFLNHSQNQNVIADKIEIDGKWYITFKVCAPIKKGEQLLFDYGLDFINKLKYVPFYFHPSDNAISDSDKYLTNKQHYSSGLFSFDKNICDIFNIDPNSQWLVPEIFHAIANNDTAKIKQLSNNKTITDLVAYEYAQNKFGPPNKQQHLTPLMFACALGNKEIINLVLKQTVDVNRCTFCTGETAFTMLLKSGASKEVIEECGNQLLDWMPYPFTYDYLQLNALHYAIEKGADKLVERLLDIAEKEINSDPFDLMFKGKDSSQNFYDFDCCLLDNKFTTLEILLKKSANSKIFLEGKLKEFVKNGKIFREDTLITCSLIQLITLKRMLLEHGFDNNQLIRLNTHIQLKTPGETSYIQKIETQHANEEKIMELNQTINALKEKLADQEKKFNQQEEIKIELIAKEADTFFDNATQSSNVLLKLQHFEKAIQLYEQCKLYYIEKLKTDTSKENNIKVRELVMSIVYCYEAMIPLAEDKKTKELYAKNIIKIVSGLMEDEDLNHYDYYDYDFFDFNTYLFQHKQNLLEFGTLSTSEKEKLKEEITQAAINITKLYIELCETHGLKGENFAKNYAKDNKLAKEYLNKNKSLKRKIENRESDELSQSKRKKTSTEQQEKPEKAEQVEYSEEEILVMKGKQNTRKRREAEDETLTDVEKDNTRPASNFFRQKKAPKITTQLHAFPNLNTTTKKK